LKYSVILALLLIQILLIPKGPACAQQSSTMYSNIVLSINDQGIISAEFKFVKPILAAPNQLSTNKFGFSIVAIPFSFNFTKSRILSSSDIKISVLSIGHGYTLLGVISPTSISNINFKLEHLTAVVETHEGKAKLEFDISFPYMSLAERELLNLSISKSSFDIIIKLPQKYDETEISFRPFCLSKIDELTYLLTSSNAVKESVSKIWIVFPNPMKSGYDNARIITGFLVAMLMVLLTKQAWRERRVLWFVVISIISMIIIFICLYYTIRLSKGIDYLTIAAGAIPTAVYCIIASIFIMITKKYQATIGGQINIDGSPAKLGTQVILYKIEGDDKTELSRLDGLETGGRYVFYRWVGKKPYKYQIIALHKGATEGVSAPFGVSRREKHEVQTINLNWRPTEEPTEELDTHLS